MATVIRIKRSTSASAPGTLKTGELAYSAGTGAYNNGGDRLYYGKGDDGSGNATTVEVVGGAYFANLADHQPGILTASSAIIVDADKKIGQLLVDNLDINDNTISATTGDLVLTASGDISANNNKIINVNDPSSAQDVATKNYVDTQVGANNGLAIIGDVGTDSINLGTESLTFAGGTGLSSVVTSNQVLFFIDSTGVSAGAYGSSTQVPVITINAQGQITAASTATISTTLNLRADSAGGPTGDVSLIDSALGIFGGEGINVSVSNTNITISGEDASITNKGVASFDSANFTVTSGYVTSKPFTIGSTVIDLGDTTTTLTGLTQVDVGNITVTGNTISSTTGGNLFIDPNPVGDSGDLIIRGNLIVQGTTTTINSTTVSLNDLNLVLADSAVNAAAADGAGITVGGNLFSGTKPTILYDAASNRWDLNIGLDLTDSIGGTKTLYFNGTKVTEAIEDHLVNNFFLAGEGIDLTYDDNANNLTVAAELATYTNRGVANFDSDQFTVTSGFVTISTIDGGTY
jgi:hypothetical protein